MLRHSRAMTRHHRERIIKKNKNLLDSLWYGGWASNKRPDGYLAKHSWHHHHCHICNDQSYSRAKAKRDERQYMGEVPYRLHDR